MFLFLKHNFIKDNEVHVKISGDNDDGNIKLLYQIANVFYPNSTDNSVLFSIFEARDIKSNIKVEMTRFRERAGNNDPNNEMTIIHSETINCYQY